MTNKNKLFNIPGYPGYKINKVGEVWSDKRQKFMTVQNSMGKFPYKCVVLTLDGKLKPQSIHKLLALTFIPLPRGYKIEDVLFNFRNKTASLVVDHIDGNKQNNDLKNLRWITQYENITNSNVDRTNVIEALKGNKRAANKSFNMDSTHRYIYQYNGEFFKSAKAVAECIGCSTSVVTESFRKNSSLVRKGIIKRYRIK